MNEEGAISALRPFGLLLLRLFDHNLLSFLILLHFKAAFVLLALPVSLSLSRLSHFLALFRINSSSRLYIYPNTTCPPPPPIPRRSGSQVGISRSSTMYKQVQHQPKHIPRHAVAAPYPSKKNQGNTESAAFLLPVAIVAACYRHQLNFPQGLPSRHHGLASKTVPLQYWRQQRRDSGP